VYLYTSNRDSWFQGDILENCPFIIIPEEISETQQQFTVKKERLMILSQTCDIEHREYVAFAPVPLVSDLLASGVSFDHKQLKDQKYLYWFYLPENKGFSEAYVDFTRITHLPKSILNKDKRIKSLSDLGRHWLAYKLSVFFGRPFSNYPS